MNTAYCVYVIRVGGKINSTWIDYHNVEVISHALETSNITFTVDTLAVMDMDAYINHVREEAMEEQRYMM